MKKNFFKKKLASALALALVVASVSPVSASAATAAKIVDKGTSKATAVLYVDKVSYGKSAVNFDLSKTYAGTTYTWTVSDSKKATIGAKTGYVVAKAPGVVKVTVTAKKGKTTTKFTQSVTIRKRATAVAAGDDFTLNTGETKSLKATLTPSTSTDAVKYVSDKEAVATVDAKTGVVTAVGAGEATITVYAKATSSAPDTSKWNVTDTVKVTVPLGIAKVQQTEATKVVLTFNGSAADKTFKTTDFKIINDSTKLEYPVSSVSVDKSAVTLTTYSSIVDGKVYNVTYGDKTLQFTATNNVVASLAFSAATVPYNTATAVKVIKKDANGVVLSTTGVSDKSDAKLEFTITTNQGYVSGDNLVLFAIGNTATATATYHTWKYDDSGKEVGAITATATITAVDVTTATVKNYKYTIAKSLPNWKTLATTNTKLAINDATQYVYFTGTDSNDNEITSGYTFASSNSDVLLVNPNSTNGTLSAEVKAAALGTAYVLVKDSKTGAVVYSLPITIVAERTAANVVLGTTSVTLSNSANVTDKANVSITKKDQYGDSIGTVAIADYSVTAVSAPNSTALAAATEGNGYFTRKVDSVDFFAPAGSATGTYTYRISVGNLPVKVVSVNIVATSGTATSRTYSVNVSDTSVDTAFDGSSNSNVDITIKVAELQGGALDGYATINPADVIVKKADGTAVAQGTGAGNYTVSGTSIVFHALTVSGSAITKAAPTNYTVTISNLPDMTTAITTDVVQPLTTGFVIKDTQPGVAATRVHDTVTTGAGASAITVANAAYSFTYEGKTYTNCVTNVDTIATSTPNTYYFKTLTITVPVTGSKGTFNVPVTVTVNQYVNFN